MNEKANIIDAIEIADQAMYIAKKNGKNSIQYLQMETFMK